MRTEEQVRGVSSVDRLCKRHDELRAEIDARDESFATVAASGKAMVAAGHFAASDVSCNLVDNDKNLNK
jgi:spectrin beta